MTLKPCDFVDGICTHCKSDDKGDCEGWVPSDREQFMDEIAALCTQIAERTVMYITVRDALAAEQQATDALRTQLAEAETIAPMTEVADRFAHRLALTLECVLFEKDQSTSRWWDEAMQLIGEYRGAMNDIHEKHSPTFMGEPVLKEQP